MFNTWTASNHVPTCTCYWVMLVPWAASPRHIIHHWESPTEDKMSQKGKTIEIHLLKWGSSPGTGFGGDLWAPLLSNAAQICSGSGKGRSHYRASAEGCSPLSAPNHRENLTRAKAVTRAHSERELTEGPGWLIFKWDSSLYKDFLCIDIQSLQTCGVLQSGSQLKSEQ